jgi:hypothetical protein
MKLHIGNERFIISHYPMVSWHGMNKGWYHLFGHTHLIGMKRFGPGRCMDIGWDGSNDKPYNIIKDCVPLLEKRPIKSWFADDHHAEDFKD